VNDALRGTQKEEKELQGAGARNRNEKFPFLGKTVGFSAGLA